MRILFTIASLLVCLSSWAQSPKVQASVNRTSISTNQTLTLTYQLNTDEGQFIPPNLNENFRIYSGPNQSTNMSWINGKTSYNVQYSYILVPTKVGEITLAPAVLKIDDQEYRSNAITITVVDASNQSVPNDQPKQNQGPSSQDIFIKTEIDKSQVYQGDQLLATYKLYTRLNLTSLEGVNLPANAGFYTSELQLDRIERHSKEVINGLAYDVYILKQTILVPQRSGELEIGALEADAVVQVRDPKPIQTFFGPRYRYSNQPMALKSRPKTIDVLPLPTPQPGSFDGSVGKYTMQVSVDKTSVNSNEAINLVVEVKGEGNVALVEPKFPEFPNDFEVYDPKITTAVSNETKVLKGTKRWEYLIIPRFGGEFTIEPIEFSYFDTEKAGYIDQSSEAITLTVAGDQSSNSEGGYSSVERRNVKKVGNDIRYIQTENSPLRSSSKVFFRSPWYYGSLILIVLMTGTIIFVLKRQEEALSDTVGIRKKKAIKVAMKRLALAQKAIEENNTTTFYDVLTKGLYDYIADKYVIERSQLSKQTIETKLRSEGTEESHIREFSQLIEVCEMARFAPSAQSDPQTLYDRAKELIVQLENKKK